MPSAQFFHGMGVASIIGGVISFACAALMKRPRAARRMRQLF